MVEYLAGQVVVTMCPVKFLSRGILGILHFSFLQPFHWDRRINIEKTGENNHFLDENQLPAANKINAVFKYAYSRCQV